MAKYLGRWTVSDVRGLGAVRIGPSGTFLRSPIDAVPRRRSGDQQRLLARIRQDGVDGSWTAEDEQGRPCVVEHGADGLEIYAPAEGEGDQAVDPEIVGTVPPGGNLDSLRRRIGPRPAHDQQTSTQQAGRMQAWQKYLDQLWAPRS
jgi:hypothetical protein